MYYSIVNNLFLGYGVIGNTLDFDSSIIGSSPITPVAISNNLPFLWKRFQRLHINDESGGYFNNSRQLFILF